MALLVVLLLCAILCVVWLLLHPPARVDAAILPGRLVGTIAVWKRSTEPHLSHDTRTLWANQGTWVLLENPPAFPNFARMADWLEAREDEFPPTLRGKETPGGWMVYAMDEGLIEPGKPIPAFLA